MVTTPDANTHGLDGDLLAQCHEIATQDRLRGHKDSSGDVAESQTPKDFQDYSQYVNNM